MAVCIGCGLTTDAQGRLVVELCPSTNAVTGPDGGLVCVAPGDADCPEGGLRIGGIPDRLTGCGLSNTGGVIAVDPCLNGGILCGDTADDAEDQCIYVNVQGQGNAICTPLATAQTACPSPNCNGLVRTCEGLWAPPKIRSTNFLGCCQDDTAGPLADITFPLGAQAALVPGSFGDGFASPTTDLAIATSAGAVIQHLGVECDACLGLTGMSYNNFAMAYFVQGGDLFRWTLWERFCMGGAVTGACTSQWAPQAFHYDDRRNDPVIPGGYLTSILLTDFSGWNAGPSSTLPDQCPLKLESMVTVNKLSSAGNVIGNTLTIRGTRQYRAMHATKHCELEFNRAVMDVNGNPLP